MKNFTFIFLLLFFFNGVLLAQTTTKDDIIKLKQNLLNDTQNKSKYNFSILNQSKQNKLTKNDDYGTPPSLNWIEQFGGSGDDYGNAIYSDSEGNIYIAGHFNSKISIDLNDYTSTGIYDGFVAKFDNTGNLIWLTQLSAAANESVKVYGLCLDASNNIYITGSYTGSVTFESISLPNNAVDNLFFAKLNSNGDVQLAKNHGNTNDTEIGLKVDVDASGNIYVLGSTKITDNYNHNSIIIKYDTNGNEIWVQEFDESFNDLKIINSNIYYAGTYGGLYGEGILNNGVELILDYIYQENAFIAKSALDGNFVWAVSSGEKDGDYAGSSYGLHISSDVNENIYLTGKFIYGTSFGNDTLIGTSNTGFNVKCTSSGTFLWAKSISGANLITGICTDNDNNSYVTYQNNVTKFDADGNELFWKGLSDTPSDITSNSSNKIITIGSKNDLISLSQLDNSATEEWSTYFGGDAGSAQIIGMVTDNLGNVYTYGNTTNTINYLGETFEKGIFICKQSLDGSLTWSKQFPDVQITESSMGDYINIDTISNRLYITGTFNSELKITDAISLTPNERGSTFIIKYDLDGNYKWSVQEDFNADDPSVVPDHDGNVIFSGIYNVYNITIGNTELVGDGIGDGFIAKYNSNGDFLWAIKAGGEDIEWSTIASTDSSNNIYVSGEFYSQNITLGDSVFSFEEGKGNILFAKLDSDGKVLWHTSFGKSDIEWRDYKCWPTGIKTDAEGYTYMKGWMGDSVYIGDILLRNPDYSFGFFISKINPEGNVVWAKPINKNGGMDYNQFDIDHKGNVYFGGSTYDTLRFGSDYTYCPAGKKDLFIAKYSTGGDLEWVKSMASTNISDDWLSSVAVYKSNNIFVSGYFKEYLSVDDNELKSNNRHGFVLMFGEDNTEATGFSDMYNKYNNVLNFYPNPSSGFIHLNLKNDINGEIEIINLSGQVVQSEQINSSNQLIDLQNLHQGIYFLRVKNNSNIKAEKLIIK